MKVTYWPVTVLFVVAGVAATVQARDERIHLTGSSTGFTWTQTDSHGYRWDIYGNGTISDGTNDAYDGGMQLQLTISGGGSSGTSSFNSFSTGKRSKDGMEVEVGPWRYRNVNTYRRIFVNRKAGYCRWIDIFENTESSAVSLSLRYYFNMGASTQRTYTTSGGTDVGEKDWGIVTSGSSSSSSRPAVAHIFATRSAKVKPRFQYSRGSDNLYYHVTLKIPAKKTVALCFFEAQRRPYESCTKFLKEFKPEKELRLVPAALRRLIVNMGGASLLVGDIELQRHEKSDLMILRNGDEMRGTIANTSFSLRASFGEVKIPAAQLIGMVSHSADAKVQMVLTGGQVVAGELTSGLIVFKLAGGTELKVPPSGLRQVAYRLSPAKPEEVVTKQSLVMLRSGQRLAFDDAKVELPFLTAHGQLKLSPGDLRFLEMDSPAGGLHRAVFGSGSTLAGLLTVEEISLDLALGPPLKTARQRVARFYFANTPIDGKGLATLKLRNSDVLHGRFGEKEWSVSNRFGDVKVATAAIASCEFSGASLGQVKLILRNGTKMGGKLQGDYVKFKIDPGPAVKVFVGHIESATGGQAPRNPATPTTTSPTTAPAPAVSEVGNKSEIGALQKRLAEVLKSRDEVKKQLAEATERAAGAGGGERKLHAAVAAKLMSVLAAYQAEADKLQQQIAVAKDKAKAEARAKLEAKARKLAEARRGT